MPRLYVDTNTFLLSTVALTFSGQVSRLQALNNGALDRLLAGASKRVDGYCHKRIQAPPTTTIAVGGGISAGATSVNLTSTLGFDNGQEEAVFLNPGGGNAEIVSVVSGGINVTSWTSPYPGTVQFAQPTQFSHVAGEPVQGLYQEVSTVGSSSSSDVYSDSLLELNQAAQLAAAHAPQFNTSGLTRVIFLKQYPILGVYLLEHMLPIDTEYETLFPGNGIKIGVQPAAGYLRLPIGSFVLPEGFFRSTYTAGYQYIPDEVQRATIQYAADELQDMMSFGAYEMSQGKLRGKYGDAKSTKSRYVQKAEEMLENGGFVRKT